jgi:carboxypeptidase family protein/all-beta uncharacterized protein
MRALFCCVLLVGVIGCHSETAPIATSPTPVRQGGPYTLSGTVRDDTGVPVQGATLSYGVDPRRSSFVSTTTDAGGSYQLAGLFAGTDTLTVFKPGYLSNAQTVTIVGDSVRDVLLRPGVIVSGKVSEAGVGGLNGVSITVISGPDAGVQTTSTGPVDGTFQLSPLLPGDFTIRASKANYDTVEQQIHAPVNTHVSITMNWAYGLCLSSVMPVSFDRVPPGGATAGVAVQAQGVHQWTAKPNVPWIDVISNATANGSATFQFQVQPNPIGALDVRSGAIEIRCGDGGGQNIWITQMVDCQVTLELAGTPGVGGTPAVFPAAGGVGRLLAHFGVTGCRSRDYSDVDWAFIAGVSSYLSGEVDFGVLTNGTGVPRVGTLVIGETRYTVRQSP